MPADAEDRTATPPAASGRSAPSADAGPSPQADGERPAPSTDANPSPQADSERPTPSTDANPSPQADSERPTPSTDANPSPQADSERPATPAGDDEATAEPTPPRPTRTLAASDANAARLKLAPSPWERFAAWLIPGTNPAGAIYGMITIGALLAAESGLHDTYEETVGSALIALAMYWIAHAYANLLGERLQTQERLSPATLMRNLLHDWAIVRGASPPLLALLIAWAVGANQEAAVTAALWTTVGSLLVYELAAGLRVRARPAELLLEGCVGAAMGLGVLALRLILH